MAGAAAIVCLAIALFHGASLHNGFVYDDHWTVVDNPFIREAGNLLILPTPVPARDLVPDAGRPLLVATEIIDHALWKEAPRGYHLQNLLWHAGAAILLLMLAARLSGNLLAAFLGSALFAVHPINVEAVAAINYREDLLAGFFVLAALVAVRGRTATVPRLALACVATALGGFAKESAAVAPILLAALDVSTARVTRKHVRDWAVLALGAAVPIAWRSWVMGAAGLVSLTAEIPAAHRDLGHAVPTGALAFARGVGQLLVPRGFSPEYADPAAKGAGWAALVVIACAAVGAFRLRRAFPWLTVAVLGSVAAYLPTLGLVPITNLRADRYFYLASMPVLCGAAFAMTSALERWRWTANRSFFDVPRTWLVAAALVIAVGVRTLNQGRIWRTDFTLWRAATSATPRSPRAWAGLAEAQLRRGETMEALASARHALSLADDPHAHELVGIVLMQQGDFIRARAALTLALAGETHEHHRAEWLNNLGYCEMQLGNLERALTLFRRAQSLAPRFDRPWLNEAIARERAGDSPGALMTLRALVERQPSSLDGWKQLGAKREAAGDRAQALQAYERARALAPRDAETRRALDRLTVGGAPVQAR